MENLTSFKKSFLESKQGKSPTKIGSKTFGVEMISNNRIYLVSRTFEAVDGLKSSNL